MYFEMKNIQYEGITVNQGESQGNLGIFFEKKYFNHQNRAKNQLFLVFHVVKLFFIKRYLYKFSTSLVKKRQCNIIYSRKNRFLVQKICRPNSRHGGRRKID